MCDSIHEEESEEFVYTVKASKYEYDDYQCPQVTCWQLTVTLSINKGIKKNRGDVDHGFRCFPLIKFQDQKLCFTFT